MRTQRCHPQMAAGELQHIHYTLWLTEISLIQMRRILGIFFLMSDSNIRMRKSPISIDKKVFVSYISNHNESNNLRWVNS